MSNNFNQPLGGIATMMRLPHVANAKGLETIRGCRGLEVIGGDLVEVAPAYDTSGNTALTAANLLFEMLCVLPGVEYRS